MNKNIKQNQKRQKQCQTNKTKKYKLKGGVNNPAVTNINTNNGFTATLIKTNTNQGQINNKNTNLCKTIFKVGKNTRKKNFIPSQFPKLTGLTQIYSQKAKKKQETINLKSSDEINREILEKEMLEKARRDVKALKEAEEKQSMYEQAVLQAKNELNKKQ